MAPPRVVEAKTFNGQRGMVEHLHKPARFEVISNVPFRQVGKAKTAAGSFPDQSRTVECQRTAYVNFKWPTLMNEFPSV